MNSIINLLNTKTCLKIGPYRLTTGQLMATAAAVTAVATYAYQALNSINVQRQTALLPSPSIPPRLIAPHSYTWAPRQLSKQDALAKMIKNQTKAIVEHQEGYSRLKNPYATTDELDLSLENLGAATRLQTVVDIAEMQGPRVSMEDSHFFIQIEQGILAGVFDGHSGSEVGRFASEQFQARFSNQLIKNDGNVHSAFESLFDTIQKEVLQTERLDSMGSTAVVCFIDKETNIAYTATLGDSEANIYRTIGQTTKSIPLSVVRDWKHEKEATRALIAMKMPLSELQKWTNEANPKFLRLFDPTRQMALNVSRALGDKQFTNYNGNPGTIHKPKITAFRVQPNDLLILACDGLKDYLPEPEIVRCIRMNRSNPAQELAQLALNNMTRQVGDNITVLSLRLESSSA